MQNFAEFISTSKHPYQPEIGERSELASVLYQGVLVCVYLCLKVYPRFVGAPFDAVMRVFMNIC